jgi:flagellar biogenesis protein FliO
MADSQIPTSADTQLATEIGVQNVLVLIIYLVLILVAAYFITKYVSKRALRRGMRKPQAGSGRTKNAQNELGHLISVADRIVIDKEKTIMVLEFNDRYYLISTTPQEMKCIDKVPIPRDIKDMAGDEQSSGAGPPPDGQGQQEEYRSFGQYLKDLWKQFRLKISPASRKGKPGAADFGSQLDKSMKKEKEKADGSNKE